MEIEHLNVLVLVNDLPQLSPVQYNRTLRLPLVYYHPDFASLLKDHVAMFRCQLGKADIARHVIYLQPYQTCQHGLLTWDPLYCILLC